MTVYAKADKFCPPHVFFNGVMGEKKIKLSNRLSVVADFVKIGANVVDVGTDHGHIPVFLLQSGKCKTVVASDINRGPLCKAKESAHLYGVERQIQFVLTEGLKGIPYETVDTVITAGMGGETIISILSAAGWTKNQKIDLILQPQSKLDTLLEWLDKNEYQLHSVKLAEDDGKIYIILLVSSRIGGTRPTIEGILSFLSDAEDPLLKEYLHAVLQKTERALLEIKKSMRIESTIQAERQRKNIEMYKRYLRGCEDWKE